MARTRVFQIFLTLYEVLGQSYLELPGLEEPLRKYLFSHQSLPQFYFAPDTIDASNHLELEALQTIQRILGEIDARIAVLRGRGLSVPVAVKAFHGDVHLSYPMPRLTYDLFCHRTEATYARFWVTAK
ncbi:MAG: hypothetical protein DLM68_04145 [Hyphomicrobiales bacterium]|nr:MAG: hypothetical protein DLM68_04145 [Hyphomicrobiales bacterium]